MADYTRTTYSNGVAPAVNATNLNNSEKGIQTNSARTSYANTIGGTANAITITTTGGAWSFAIGEPVRGIATANNTGAVTAQVDGGTVYTVKKLDGSTYIACEADDFEDNKPFELIGANDGTDFLLLSPKGGNTITSLQRISTSISTSNTDVSITQVDLSKAAVYLDYVSLDPQASLSVAQRNMMNVDFLDDSTVRLSVNYSSTYTNIPDATIVVEEYGNSKSIQRGTNTSTGTVNITINSVNILKAKANMTHRSNSGENSARNYHRLAKLTSATNLEIRSALGGDMIWQVVEFK